MLLRQNYTFVTPTTFQRQTTFILEVKSQKSIISEKSQKSRKNCQKSRFFEKFWLLWLPTSVRAISLLPVLDRTVLRKNWKKIKKLLAGMTFLKKSVFDPPQPAKSAIHEISTKMGPYTKSFFHHFQTTCKVSSTSDGSFPRSQNFLHPGSLVKGILSGRAPYPANLGKTCYLNVWTRPPSSVRSFASRQAVKLFRCCPIRVDGTADIWLLFCRIILYLKRKAKNQCLWIVPIHEEYLHAKSNWNAKNNNEI